MIENYCGNCISNTYLPNLYCSFVVYEVEHHLQELGYVRLYVDITHDKKHSGVPYVDKIDISFTTSEYKEIVEADKLLENITFHYLSNMILEVAPDEYYH